MISQLQKKNIVINYFFKFDIVSLFYIKINEHILCNEEQSHELPIH